MDEGVTAKQQAQRLEALRGYLANVKKIRQPDEDPSEKKTRAFLDEQDELDRKQAEWTVGYQEKLARLEAIKAYYKHRVVFAWCLFGVMIFWILAILTIVLATGLALPLLSWLIGFDLQESVILALVGSTTANVLGLFYIVARYLYPQAEKGETHDGPPSMK